MTKFRLLGVAALFSVLMEPAMAQRVVAGPDPYYVRSGRCGHHQLGNPYTPEQDYMAWSAWRSRGSWAEPPYDPACSRVRHPHRRWHGY
ncbi:hypothetical protein GALL_508850 [mine drainage metagenome]|jgi:hypothetical protein|uniref:Uncharacterized protein n=1 Tax=mine drainage metagenome TaxID=410659 RepID=A0A1J5PIC1_9ZZZZ